MAIFNQHNKAKPSQGKSIISNGCTIRGELELNADCHIDGSFEGNIFSQNNIVIGQSGYVNGFILANNIIISGQFNGQINCTSLELKSSGVAHGEIKADNIVFESGSVFTGYSHKADSNSFYNILPEEVKTRLETNNLIALEVEDADADTTSSKDKSQATIKKSHE